jgi:hypothetical protein
MVCPDYYLTVARTPVALQLLADMRDRDGFIDFWAHTEEVTTPEQIAAWESVVNATASAKDVWVAPLAEIAVRQQRIDALRQTLWHDSRGTHIRIENTSADILNDVVLALDGGWQFVRDNQQSRVVDILPRQSLVIDIRPAK